MPDTAALRAALADALPERPFTVSLWDGSEVPTTGTNGPTFTARSPQALAHVLRAPGELGLGRAYVAGALDVDDLDAVIRLLDDWRPPELDRRHKARLLVAAARATGLVRPPAAPGGRAHPARALPLARARRPRRAPPLRRAVGVLPALPRPVHDLLVRDLLARRDDARAGAGGQARADLPEARAQARPARARRRLRLGRVRHPRRQAPRRARHRHHDLAAAGGARALGRRGGGRRAISWTSALADYRDLAGETYDAVASIGMVEHVGAEQMDEYGRRLRGALRPGGTLLLHGIANLQQEDPQPGPFSSRYVFPDGAPQPLSRMLLGLERAGFEAHHIEGFRDDYAETLRHWARVARRPRRRRRPARGRRARARLAAVPAGGPQRLRDRFHVGLSGPRVVTGAVVVRVHRGGRAS